MYERSFVSEDNRGRSRFRAHFCPTVATISARAHLGATRRCRRWRRKCIARSTSAFFPLITSAIMKAPYYYQLALWLVGSSNERTGGRTLRYRIPRMFSFVGGEAGGEADHPRDRSGSKNNIDPTDRPDESATDSCRTSSAITEMRAN